MKKIIAYFVEDYRWVLIFLLILIFVLIAMCDRESAKSNNAVEQLNGLTYGPKKVVGLYCVSEEQGSSAWFFVAMGGYDGKYKKSCCQYITEDGYISDKSWCKNKGIPLGTYIDGSTSFPSDFGWIKWDDTEFKKSKTINF